MESSGGTGRSKGAVMRQRRAILFEDDSLILDVVRLFFEARGYEVVACSRPVICPVYDCRDGCAGLSPCGDLMLTDYRMPEMTGLELLQTQARMGCRMDVKNKAVMSGFMDDAARAAFDAMGCYRFDKPFTLDELRNWVAGCESRMDLNMPLKSKRRELRQRCSADIVLRAPEDGDMRKGRAINWSSSGLCIVVNRPPALEQMLEVRADMPVLRGRHRVRWSRPLPSLGYVVGMLRC